MRRRGRRAKGRIECGKRAETTTESEEQSRRWLGTIPDRIGPNQAFNKIGRINTV